jgi:hypothetical protein
MIQEDHKLKQLELHFGKNQKQARPGAWWYTAIIPATQFLQIGGSQFEASLGKSMRSYMKNKQMNKAKRLGACLRP